MDHFIFCAGEKEDNAIKRERIEGRKKAHVQGWERYRVEKEETCGNMKRAEQYASPTPFDSTCKCMTMIDEHSCCYLMKSPCSCPFL
jgi:hypothetical protein